MSSQPTKFGSIFEYLTVKNPEVTGQYQYNKRQSEQNWWAIPRYIEPWEDFNFDTMEKIFGGKLMEECRQDRGFYITNPVLVPKAEDNDSGEPAATAILNSWTRHSVNTALAAVKDTLNPVFWAQQSDAAPVDTDAWQTKEIHEDERNRASGSNSTQTGAKRSVARQRSVRPDAAGIDFSTGKPISKLPKEIKSGSTWDSTSVIKDRRGDTRGWINTNTAAPLRQIYQQCIQTRSRYGCIITTREVLMVRVRPYKKALLTGVRKDKTATMGDNISASMKACGLMEYKSIPWSSHRGEGESVGDFKTMTMNLAIWFQHVLAGNNHELAWNYSPLIEEVLINNNRRQEQENSGAPLEPSHSRKKGAIKFPPTDSFTSVAHSESDSQRLLPVSQGVKGVPVRHHNY